MPDDDLRSQLVDLIDSAADPVTFDEVRSRTAPRRRVRGRVTAAIAVAAVIAVALGAAVAITRREPTGPARPRPAATTTTTKPTAVRVDQVPKLPASAIETFHLPPNLHVSHAVAAFGSLWLVGYQACEVRSCPPAPGLFRLDRAVGALGGIPGVAADGLDVVSGDGSLFVLSGRDGSPYHVTRIDIPSYRVRYIVDVPDTHVYGTGTFSTGRIVFGFGSIWVFDGRNAVARLDARTGRQVARVALPPNTTSNGLAVNRYGVWSVALGGTSVTRIDPGSNHATIATTFGPGYAQTIATDDAGVWVTHSTKTSIDLARIDARDPARVDSTRIETADVAAGGGGVWFLGWVPPDAAGVPINHAGLIGRVDPRTLAVTAITALPIPPNHEGQLTVGDGAAWVVDNAAHRAWRIQPPS